MKNEDTVEAGDRNPGAARNYARAVHGGRGVLRRRNSKIPVSGLAGAGRFARIGIPVPGAMGPFVGTVEIICGALIFVGLLTRLAAIPLLFNISVAILSTKIPILLGHD